MDPAYAYPLPHNFEPMIRLLLLIALLLLLGPACDNASTAPPVAAAPTIDTLAIQERLFAQLTADTNRAGREQNLIINYAADRAWDLRRLPGGVYYQITSEGSGAELQTGDRVQLHYRGRFPLTGEVFDASRPKGRPLEFTVGRLIPAWNEVLPLVKPGATVRLVTPSAAAYGPEGLKSPDGTVLVPPHAVLVFELEAIEVIERADLF